jgi:hypothetical protein
MLSKADWDFQGLLDDQVEECWTYEYARERNDLVTLIEEWRGDAPKPHEFRSLKRYAGGQKTSGLWIKRRLHLIPLGAYFMFPEWPTVPFQEIEPGKRRKRFRALLENEKTIGLPVTKEAKAAERAWKAQGVRLPALREIEPHPTELGAVVTGDSICIPSSVFRTPKVLEESTDQQSTDQIVIFRIPWDRPDEGILELLARWLRANRPRKFLKQGVIGGSNVLRKKRKELERLGKWRVVRFREGDYRTEWDGKRLFADQSKWINCRKSVEGIIASLRVVS